MPTILESLTVYERHQHARGLAKGSIARSSGTLRQLAAILGNPPVADLEHADLVPWQAAVAETGVSTTTLHHKTRFIKTFFAWCADMRWVGVDPTKRLAMPRRARSLPAVLTEDEMRLLLRWRPRYSWRYQLDLGLRDAALVRLMLLAGLRRAEVCALNLGDVSLGAKTLAVRAGKGERDRMVALPDSLVDDLERYLKARLRMRNGRDIMSEPLFIGRRGKRLSPDAVSYIFIRKVRECGIQKRVTPHTLRHSYGTYLCRKGVSVRKIQELMGHSSLATTQVYLHVSQADLQEAVQVLDELEEPPMASAAGQHSLSQPGSNS